MQQSLIFLTFFILVSCDNERQATTTRFFPISSIDTTFEYGNFSITVPNTWRQPNDDTLIKLTDATATGRIQIGANEFIWYSDGLGASDWSEYSKIVPTKDKEIYTKNKLDTAYIFFSDRPELIDTSKLKIHKVWYGQNSGFKTKYFEPKKIGFGYTGLYIDSVSEIKGISNMNFAIFANKLDSSRNAALVKALLTVKYKGTTY